METEENRFQEDSATPQKDYIHQKMIKQIKEFKQEHKTIYFAIFMILLAAEVVINVTLSYFKGLS